MSKKPATLAEAHVALEEAQRSISALQEALEAVSAPPFGYGVVARVDTYGVTLRTEKGTVIAPLPNGTIAKKVAPGATVLFALESGVITSIVTTWGTGGIAVVVSVCSDDPGKVEVTISGGTLRVFADKLHETTKPLKSGEEVVLDATNTVIVHRVPSKVPPPIVDESRVLWDSITGHSEAKAALREIIESPLSHPELYGAYKKRATKGVLLYGPPGCGKTMLGKAAATAIQGVGSVTGFLYVKATDLLNPYAGESERLVRSLFEKAKHHKRDHGTPAVIFIDEADAILGKRGQLHSMMEKTIVPAFLTEMDGMESSNAVVILATNRPDTLDPAVIREGRIDRKILVGRPQRAEIEHLTASYLSKVPLDKSLNVADASVVMGTLMLSEEGKPTALGKQASGSLIAGIVDRAASAAFQRDMRANREKPTGVNLDDLGLAVNMIQAETVNANTNHLAS